MNRTTAGFTLIALLVVLAVLGVLAAVFVAPRPTAPDPARDRAAAAYVERVYWALRAFLVEHPEATTVATDCLSGYVPGPDARYVVPAPDPFIRSCTVALNNLSVTVTYTGGVVDHLRLGH